jgi:succinate-semialdehyde dehydrogenase/glutarate-semialdehyde dehydrogenase
VTKEMGERIQEATGEVLLAASILTYYAEKGPGFLAPKPIDVMQVVVDDPIGVLLAIEPWNHPLHQVVRVAGPNLVLGDTIVLKHAEQNPQTALAPEQSFRDAGAPEGVYTDVFLAIADIEKVIAHQHVRGVTLTGASGPAPAWPRSPAGTSRTRSSSSGAATRSSCWTPRTSRRR